MPASILLSSIFMTLTTLLTIISLSLSSTVLLKLLASMSSLGFALAIFTILLSFTAALSTLVLLNLINFISSLAGILILVSGSVVSNILLLPTTLLSAGATSLGFISSVFSAFFSLSISLISTTIIP